MPGTTSSVWSTGKAVSSPVVPMGASSNGTSFSSRACGAWSVATQSMVPSHSAAIRAVRSASVRSGGFIFSAVSSPSSRALSVRVRWWGVTSALMRTPPAFAALHTGLVLTGTLGLGLLVERMTAGAALFELPVPLIARGEPANLTLVDLDAEWVAGEHGWESRSENCCFGGRAMRGRVLLTLAAGSVVYRERAFSVVAA